MKRRSVKCSNKRGVVSSEKKMARGLREMNGTWETMLNFAESRDGVSELKHKCIFLFYFVFGYKNKKVYLRLDVSNFVRVWKITTQRKF
jgi:hypothetical protein